MRSGVGQDTQEGLDIVTRDRRGVKEGAVAMRVGGIGEPLAFRPGCAGGPPGCQVKSRPGVDEA
jgi:hypothetical protein